MLRWIVTEYKLDSDVCEDTFWEDRIDGNAEKFPDCVMATGEASVPDKHHISFTPLQSVLFLTQSNVLILFCNKFQCQASIPDGLNAKAALKTCFVLLVWFVWFFFLPILLKTSHWK